MATRPTRHQPIHPRTRWASLSVIVGAALMLLGMSDRTTAGVSDTEVVALHNDRADGSTDCPPGAAAWHFVIAPNDGTYRFESVSLMLDGTLFTFEGDDLLRNGQQADNVFIRVPAGYQLHDLDAVGSYAEIAPASVSSGVMFVLSGECDYGSGSSTTTTTTTTVPTTTTSTTSAPGGYGTTTVPTSSTTTTTTTTTTSVPGGYGTTTVPTSPSTTTTEVAQSPPTTTSTTVAGSTTSTSTSTSTSTTVRIESTTTSSTPTTSVVPTTTTGETTTTDVGQSGPTTTVSTGGPTTVAPQLPATGTGGGRLALLIGTALILLGGIVLIGSSRFAEAAV